MGDGRGEVGASCNDVPLIPDMHNSVWPSGSQSEIDLRVRITRPVVLQNVT